MSDKTYTLMHKNVPVVDVVLNCATGTIRNIETIYDSKHLPVGIPYKRSTVERGILNFWWINRAIPSSRDKLRDAMEKLGVFSTSILLERCLGLSLSDHYWMRPLNSQQTWEQVNFFQNDFSLDIGRILLGGNAHKTINWMAPDSTTDGWLRKRWTILDDKRVLVKGGSGAFHQEPYNEAFASMVMDRLGIPHISYSVVTKDGYPYSLCEDFVSTETEFIPAWYLMQTQKKQNHLSVFQHYLNCCNDVGLADIQTSLNQMIVLDYLIGNEDRHQNNFGVIRNANTLKFLGAAPIFDSGTSLWFNKPTSMVGERQITCKPFKSKHDEQLRLVASFNWIDFSQLKDLEDAWMELTADSLFLDEPRRIAIAKAFRQRVDELKVTATRKNWYTTDNLLFDVTKDKKYNG